MNARLRNVMALLIWEMRIQFRYYFWLAALVISVVWLLLLSTLSTAVTQVWVPVLIFGDISNIGMVFIAGILYLERRQGTLVATAVTPLSPAMWLALKCTGLTVLCTVCAVALVLLNIETVNWAKMLPAIMLCSALFVGCGFLIANPFTNILNYFLAMALGLLVLNVPIFAHLDVLQHGAFWLLPTQPAMWLLGESVQDSDNTRFLLVLGVQALWLAAIYWWCIRSLRSRIAFN